MQESVTKTKVTRKFGIKRILNGMKNGRARDAREELAEKLGLTYHHFVRLTNAVVGDRFKLDSDQLQVIADYFDVSVDSLLTPFDEESSRL